MTTQHPSKASRNENIRYRVEAKTRSKTTDRETATETDRGGQITRRRCASEDGREDIAGNPRRNAV